MWATPVNTGLRQGKAGEARAHPVHLILGTPLPAQGAKPGTTRGISALRERGKNTTHQNTLLPTRAGDGIPSRHSNSTCLCLCLYRAALLIHIGIPSRKPPCFLPPGLLAFPESVIASLAKGASWRMLRIPPPLPLLTQHQPLNEQTKNKWGLARWLSGWRGLPPSLMTVGSIPGPCV